MENRNGQNVRVFQFRTGQSLMFELLSKSKSKFHRFISSHKRKVFLRDGMIWSHSPFVYQEEDEEIEERIVLF
jgi:sulfate adenylyltransferase subunit 2